MEPDQVRKTLRAERDRLEREIHELESDLADSLDESSGESAYDQHMAEMASVTLDREIDLALEDGVRAALARIDRAIAKLEEGTYGRCDSCGKEIGRDRLAVAPYATLCMDCKRREERGR
jgi:RNA polymerase-binding protein DksA